MANRFDQIFRFLSDTRNLEQGTGRVERKMGGLKGTVAKVGGVIAGAFAAGAVIDFTKQTIGLAISADEAASKFDAVFASSGEATAKMAEFADKAGVATATSQDLFATLGNLTNAQGFSRDASIEFADKIGDLAGDLASFNDADPAEVFRELGFAMTTTERESLKKYGIAISEAEVKTRALEIATQDGRDEVTKADRAIATYQLTLEQAGQAVGDLDRTSDSLANRMRRLNARWEDAQVVLGRELVPVLEESLIPALEAAIPVAAEFFRSVGGGVQALQGVLNPTQDWNREVEDTRGWLDKARDSSADFLDNLTELTGGVEGIGRDFALWGDLIRATNDDMMEFERTNAEARFADIQMQEAKIRLQEIKAAAEEGEEALKQMGRFAYDELRLYNDELSKTPGLLDLSREAADRFFRTREGVYRYRTGSAPEQFERSRAPNVQPVNDAAREEQRNQGATR